MSSEATVPFRYYLRVRYSECDSQKVVFNSRYAEYTEIATAEYMRALGFGDDFAAGRLDYQLVRQTLEWKASARFDEVIEAQVTTRHLGTTSFSLGVELRRPGSDALMTSIETVYVLVDSGLRKTPLTTAFREALLAGAPGRVTDHAGFLGSAGA